MSGSLLIGLDFGTTTSHCVLAQAEVHRNSVLGKREFAGAQMVYRSEPVFTPVHQGRVDVAEVKKILTTWKKASGEEWSQVVGGGALLTGLTSRSETAGEMMGLLREMLPDLLVINAEDPLLESWVSCVANCQGMMATHPEETFINFDIGGGTTNIGTCRGGEVLSTDWKMIGARHLVFETGTYRIREISDPGNEILKKLRLKKSVGDELSSTETHTICHHFVQQLEKIAKAHPESKRVFSGGVGELLYSKLSPTVTPFGDLGVDLAKDILESEILSRDLQTHIPESKGRATVLGIALHTTQMSGDSIFAASDSQLPLQLPIRGTLSNGQLGESGAYFVDPKASLKTLKAMAPRIARTLARTGNRQPYVFLMEANLGKLFGNWIRLHAKFENPLFVIDEIAPRPAHYLVLGKRIHQNVPVTLYGFTQ